MELVLVYLCSCGWKNEENIAGNGKGNDDVTQLARSFVARYPASRPCPSCKQQVERKLRKR